MADDKPHVFISAVTSEFGRNKIGDRPRFFFDLHCGLLARRRGNNRGACFFADDDYTHYLAHLRELAGALGDSRSSAF
jgi:hypothetical protein